MCLGLKRGDYSDQSDRDRTYIGQNVFRPEKTGHETPKITNSNGKVTSPPP